VPKILLWREGWRNRRGREEEWKEEINKAEKTGQQRRKEAWRGGMFSLYLTAA